MELFGICWSWYIRIYNIDWILRALWLVKSYILSDYNTWLLYCLYLLNILIWNVAWLLCAIIINIFGICIKSALLVSYLLNTIVVNKWTKKLVLIWTRLYIISRIIICVNINMEPKVRHLNFRFNEWSKYIIVGLTIFFKGMWSGDIFLHTKLICCIAPKTKYYVFTYPCYTWNKIYLI